MRRGLITGFVTWAAAFVLFRTFGQFLLGSPAAMQTTFLAGGAICAVIAVLACRFICSAGKTARFAAGIAIPGLLLGSACVLSFDRVFPGMELRFAAAYGGLLLWFYGIVLAAILLFGDRVAVRK